MTTSVGLAEIAIHVLIEQIIADIKEQYQADNTPWIIGFSGGKDRALLEEVCQEHDVPTEFVEQLLQIKKDRSGLMRRNNLFKGIDMALKNYLKRKDYAFIHPNSTGVN